MSRAIENLEEAMKRAADIRPKVGGFPFWRRRCGGLA